MAWLMVSTFGYALALPFLQDDRTRQRNQGAQNRQIPTVQELIDLLVVTRGRGKLCRSQMVTPAPGGSCGKENRSVRCNLN